MKSVVYFFLKMAKIDWLKNFIEKSNTTNLTHISIKINNTVHCSFYNHPKDPKYLKM